MLKYFLSDTQNGAVATVTNTKNVCQSCMCTTSIIANSLLQLFTRTVGVIFISCSYISLNHGTSTYNCIATSVGSVIMCSTHDLV